MSVYVRLAAQQENFTQGVVIFTLCVVEGIVLMLTISGSMYLSKGETKMNNEVRTIKRYQNRKLYDTHQSCYVTLEEIAHIVREGHEIVVVDNRTKNDITYNTQIQLLFDQERKSDKVGDTELLKRVIRSSEGTFTGYIKELEASETREESDSRTEEETASFNPAAFASTSTTETLTPGTPLN